MREEEQAVLSRDEVRSLTRFAAYRRDPTEPWREKVRGVEYAVAITHNGQPKLTPSEVIFVDSAPARTSEELEASVGIRTLQRELDRELIRKDSLSLPHVTGKVTFSVSMARETDITAAIVYRLLQAEQSQSLYDETRFHEWRRWSAASANHLKEWSLPFLGSRQVVTDAIERLRPEFIVTETTGKFLPADHRTGRKRDLATWCHTKRPIDYDEPSLSFDVVTAKLHGIKEAILIAHLQRPPTGTPEIVGSAGERFFKVVATELEKVMPIGEKTIRSVVADLVSREVVQEHPLKSGYFRLADVDSTVGMNANHLVKFHKWRTWYFEQGPGLEIMRDLHRRSKKDFVG